MASYMTVNHLMAMLEPYRGSLIVVEAGTHLWIMNPAEQGEVKTVVDFAGEKLCFQREGPLPVVPSGEPEHRSPGIVGVRATDGKLEQGEVT